jgi:hypothetical protein
MAAINLALSARLDGGEDREAEVQRLVPELRKTAAAIADAARAAGVS